jgi:metal-responsive CopG/Arc/MetJ family transcriptional regulator
MEHSIRLSVTVRPELKRVADEIAKENKITRSKLISQCLEELARKRKEELLIKYYKTMAKEHGNFAMQSAAVIQNIAASWRD